MNKTLLFFKIFLLKFNIFLPANYPLKNVRMYVWVLWYIKLCKLLMSNPFLYKLTVQFKQFNLA